MWNQEKQVQEFTSVLSSQTGFLSSCDTDDNERCICPVSFLNVYSREQALKQRGIIGIQLMLADALASISCDGKVSHNTYKQLTGGCRFNGK